MSQTDSSDRVPIPGLPADWPQRATSALVDKVDDIRDKTSGPAIGVARAVVYGVLALPLVVAALVLLIIALVRLLDSYIPEDVWIPYLILGGVFTLAGFFLWSRRPRGAAVAKS